MANVDFGDCSPSESSRVEIEGLAASLPQGWDVTLEMKWRDPRSMQSGDSRSLFVVVNGDNARYARQLDHDRFDLAASFLRELMGTFKARRHK